MKILEASGIYRENLSDMCMWEKKHNDRNDFIVIAIIMFSMIIKTSIRNWTLW